MCLGWFLIRKALTVGVKAFSFSGTFKYPVSGNLNKHWQASSTLVLCTLLCSLGYIPHQLLQ